MSYTNADLHREYLAFLRRTLPPPDAAQVALPTLLLHRSPNVILMAKYPQATRARAAEKACRAMGLLLTDAGTDAASVNRDGLTPLMAAAASGGGAVALNLLVAAGAAVNTAVAGGQRAGWTAVMYAAAAGDAVAAEALCKLGADASAACARRRTAVRLQFFPGQNQLYRRGIVLCAKTRGIETSVCRHSDCRAVMQTPGIELPWPLAQAVAPNELPPQRVRTCERDTGGVRVRPGADCSAARGRYDGAGAREGAGRRQRGGRRRHDAPHGGR
jgi:hypothetical protein